MSNRFWKDKNVLITGYEGFLGSWLSKTLLKSKANIFGLDILTHRKETILTSEDLQHIYITKGSVENYSLVSNIIEKNKIELIFHLAAKALVGECLNNPLKSFSTNIKGTWNILEISRNCNTIKAIIIASSDKAYGNNKNLPYREDFPLMGNHPYDVSKSCADLLASTYFHTYGLPVCITRCGNIYGLGDFNFSRIVPDTMLSIAKRKSLVIRSDGKFTRDYVYIEDIVRGYILLAENLQKLMLSGEAFNFSNESPISVLELVKKIYQLDNRKVNCEILNQVRAEIKDQYLSAKKAKKVLGWKSKYTLEEGLKKTIKWYKNYFLENLFKTEE